MDRQLIAIEIVDIAGDTERFRQFGLLELKLGFAYKRDGSEKIVWRNHCWSIADVQQNVSARTCSSIDRLERFHQQAFLHNSIQRHCPFSFSSHRRTILTAEHLMRHRRPRGKLDGANDRSSSCSWLLLTVVIEVLRMAVSECCKLLVQRRSLDDEPFQLIFLLIRVSLESGSV